jgi:hypothetical protein
LDVIEEARDPLISVGGVRELLELRIEEPAQLEHRWKAIVDDSERRAGLSRAAPGKIE